MKLLNQRLQKEPMQWNEECTKAMQNIKEIIHGIQPLSPIQENWKKVIMTDASNVGWGAVFCQENLEKRKDPLEICQYASGLWSKTQMNWASLKKELRAVCLGIEKFKDFVIYTKFLVKTDCQALKFAIHKFRFDDAAMVRRIMTLSQYNFEIEFIPGHRNSFSDMLSRELLEKNSIHSLSYNFIRRNEDYVEIESVQGWVRYENIRSVSLLNHEDDWYPLKEIH